MSNSPKVSVIIPVHNRERYLGIAIQSVLAQTYTGFELIIVDNNSTDGSLEIAQIAAQNDSRVRVLIEEIQGAAYALRTGFAAAKGEYLCQLDSDDLLESVALERTVAVLDTDSECGLVYTNYVDIDQDGKKTSVGWRCSHPYTPDKLLTVFMVFHFRLIRKTVYEQVGGFDPEFDKIEDYDLCLKLSEITKVVNIPELLYLKRNHPESILNTCRLEVIQLTQKAIEAALERRGMSKTHQVEVKYNPQWSVVRK